MLLFLLEIIFTEQDKCMPLSIPSLSSWFTSALSSDNASHSSLSSQSSGIHVPGSDSGSERDWHAAGRVVNNLVSQGALRPHKAGDVDDWQAQAAFKQGLLDSFLRAASEVVEKGDASQPRATRSSEQPSCGGRVLQKVKGSPLLACFKRQ